MTRDVSALVLILIEAISIPAAIAFADEQFDDLGWQVFVICFFTIDIICNMITSYEATNGTVTDARRTAVRASFFHLRCVLDE